MQNIYLRALFLLVSLVVASKGALAFYDDDIKERIIPQGEIADGSKKLGRGIVMLFDKQKNKNVFVKIGEQIPGTRFRVIRVERNGVVVSEGTSEIKLMKDKFLAATGVGTSGKNSYDGYSPKYNDDSFCDGDDSLNAPRSNDGYASAQKNYAPPPELADDIPPPPPPYNAPGLAEDPMGRGGEPYAPMPIDDDEY